MVAPCKVTENPYMVSCLNVSIPVGDNCLVHLLHGFEGAVGVEDDSSEAVLVRAVAESDNPQ